MRTIQIAGRHIGPNRPPFIIAEMSGNHNQSLERALEIVEAVAKTGTHGYATRPLIRIGAMMGEASA